MSAPNIVQKAQHDAKLYWIHCNRCFEMYMRKRRRFFLLACQHIACENCAQIAIVTPSGGVSCNCPICKKNVRVCQLGNTMASHLKELFHPSAWEGVSGAAHIIRFQNKHREHFMRGMAQMYARRNEQKTALEQQRAQIQTLYVEHEKMCRQRIPNEQRVREIIIRRKQEKQERRRIETLRPTRGTTYFSLATVDNRPAHSRVRFLRGYGRGSICFSEPCDNAAGPRMHNLLNSSNGVTSFTQPRHGTNFTL